jgi:outer membrane protein OmpA-like peptidoglycan-associated protein
MKPNRSFRSFLAALAALPLLFLPTALAEEPAAPEESENATTENTDAEAPADESEDENQEPAEANTPEPEPTEAEEPAADDTQTPTPAKPTPAPERGRRPAPPTETAADETQTPTPAKPTPAPERGRRPAPPTETAAGEEPDPATPTEPGEEPAPRTTTAEEPMTPAVPIPQPGEPERPRTAETPTAPGAPPRRPQAERPQPAEPEPAVDPIPAEVAEAPPTEPERQAETRLRETTREVERELSQRAAKIQQPQEAQLLFDEIIGAESRISRAEIEREERIRPRMEERRGRQPIAPEMRQETVEYFQQRLLGQQVEGPPPQLLRLSETRREQIYEQRIERVEIHEERVEFHRPRYLNEGRRYVHFDSRASVPPILLAAQAMNYVTFQPVHQVPPTFYEPHEVYVMPLPPENFRDESAVVVSYPVDEKSMITSDDILFQQGSTQFADPYSYEIVASLADAMKALPAEERFVIEGHASAEGSYEGNMVLSQQRAERIVREMVRRGVSPYRLLPVGYGESEARHPADAPEPLRSQDRRVVVFRLGEEPMAAR